MRALEILNKAAPLMPVLEIRKPETARPMAEALAAGGIHCLEITLRTPCALEVIEDLAKQFPEMCIGAGTVTTAAQLDAVLEAGAEFVLSPGLSPELADAARRAHCTFIPGVMTPSEVMVAKAMGFDCLKLFPAAVAGGVSMLKAMGGPFSEITFCPTGGVSPDNMLDFLALPNVACVGGSWVATASMIENGDYDAITAQAKAAVQAAE